MIDFIKKISFAIILLFIGTTSVVAEAASAQPILRVAGWDAYADPEQRNKTIGFKSFEKKFGYKIIFTPLTNLDEIINYAESNDNVDVLIISNEGIETLKKMGLVDRLDLQKVPNYQDLHHSLKYSAWSQFDGNIYAVPWAWGPTGLLFDTDKLPDPVSWNILWDPKYKGKVSLWNDVSLIWTAALALGYNNVYNLTLDQLANVEKKLLELNDQVYSYYSGEREEMELLRSGKVFITNSWFDPSRRLAKHNKNFKMVIPKEGAVGMFDSYLLGRNSKLIEVSHQYINHQISPEVQMQMSHITGLAPSNIEALALMSQKEIKALHLDDQNYFRRMLLWDVMPRKHLYDKLLRKIQQDRKTRELRPN